MNQSLKPEVRRVCSPSVLLAAVALVVLAACSKPEPDSSSGTPSTEFGSSDCDKLPDPKPTDVSATSAARAAQAGEAMRKACKEAVAAKSKARSDKDDLARIRELMEQKHADEAEAKRAREAWAKGVKEGGAAPLETFKY